MRLCRSDYLSAKMFSAKIFHQKIGDVITFKTNLLRYNLLIWDLKLI